MKLKYRLLLYVVVAIVLLVLAWLAVRQWGLVGGLVLAPIAAGGAVVGAVAKGVGAAPLEAPKNRPRRGTVAATPADPKPEEKKRRTRPRRGSLGKWG